MPKFNRIRVTNLNKHTKIANKTQIFQHGEEELPVLQAEVEDTVISCYPAHHDCNWFLAKGCRDFPVSKCQLGVAYNPSREEELFRYAGSVTYRVRPGKIVRQGFTMWADSEYSEPVLQSNTTYSTPLLINFNVSNTTYNT